MFSDGGEKCRGGDGDKGERSLVAVETDVRLVLVPADVVRERDNSVGCGRSPQCTRGGLYGPGVVGVDSVTVILVPETE